MLVANTRPNCGDCIDVKQILQNLATGFTELADVPVPATGSERVLIRTSRSLISAGTERMLVEFSRANLLEKARQQPDRVRQVLAKAATDGVWATLSAVRNKLDEPLPLGYCNTGVVVAVGDRSVGFTVGDRVVSNGPHAEVVAVPRNLCAAVPDAVTDDEAAFTVIGAIALQGVRLAQPTLGEVIVVSGLGLIGLIAVQLLRAHGCRVIGLDVDAARLAIAQELGAETVDLSSGVDPVAAANAMSRGRGVDAVLLTAATKSSEPVHLAAQMARKRGRIVLVGQTGLDLARADFYEKELSFQVSCSYGPGRYDPAYELHGCDYPVGFVRWTAQRNFEAVLDMMAAGRLNVMPLISHRFRLEQATAAYDLITGVEPSLGIVLEYPSTDAVSEGGARTLAVKPRSPGRGRKPVRAEVPSVSFLGTGNYASGVLMPAFAKTGVRLRACASRGGVSAVHAAKKFGFEQASTDIEGIISDSASNVIVIASRHDSHAQLAAAAIRAGKHVFVEKPLALTHEQLRQVEDARSEVFSRGAVPMLMVGFNRRFAPHVVMARRLLGDIKNAKSLLMTVNAGYIPPGHWTQDRAIGGGRIVGEACHFIDLMRFLVGSPIVGFDATALRDAGQTAGSSDSASITLRFTDGSVGTIIYASGGHKAFPKERLEVFAGGAVLQLDNFRVLRAFGWKGFSRSSALRQDKGQRACVSEFVSAIRSAAEAPIPFEEILEVSRISIEVAEALR